ncbi:MAG: hypothetical protein LBH50_01245 [Spirochaetaceae bacterium]|nr:hypothetical protein [Spirochaetaceae bacterium]
MGATDRGLRVGFAIMLGSELRRGAWRVVREAVIAKGRSACEADGTEGDNDMVTKTSTRVRAETVQWREG